VDCSYRMLGSDRVGFYAPCRDREMPLVIDPGLTYSTFLGGSIGDAISGGLAVDSAGAMYVSGFTDSPDFPATPGAYDTTLDGITDAFVAKLGPNGDTLVYATFLGATAENLSYAIAVDASGSACVVGVCAPGFPTTPGAFDTTFNSPLEGFVTK